MKYKGRLIKIEPADPGFAYPTYEYTDENGQVQQITGKDGVAIFPWDFNKTHTIYIDNNGELEANGPNGLLWALGIMAAFFAIGIGGPMLSERFFGLIFIAVAFIPAFVFGRQHAIKSKRRRSARHLEPTQGEIVWYHEVRKRSKNSSHTYHYPIVQYQYMGQTFTTVIYDDESPVHKGDIREFYIDIANEDVFTKNQCKGSLLGVSAIFTCFYTLPFLAVGLGIAFPELADVLLDIILGHVQPGTAIDLSSIMQYAPFVMIGFFALVILTAIIKILRDLIPMLQAKKSGNIVYAVHTGSNDYGRTHVQMYEYTYMGRQRTYQSRTHMPQSNLELYVHPNNGKAYSKTDITIEFVKLGILLFMTIFTGLTSIPFKEAITNW